MVVLIWQFTQAYNDFLFAVVLTSNQTWPVTVALNNLAGSQIVQWNVRMAGALPTLLVYILLGRFFPRGLMAGALKGLGLPDPRRAEGFRRRFGGGNGRRPGGLS